MDRDPCFKSLTSNLCGAQERSNVVYAVRIYHYFSIVPMHGVIPHSDVYTFPFLCFLSLSSSYTVFKIGWKWTAISFLNYYGFHYSIIRKLHKHAIITMMTLEAIIVFSQRRVRGTEVTICLTGAVWIGWTSPVSHRSQCCTWLWDPGPGQC